MKDFKFSNNNWFTKVRNSKFIGLIEENVNKIFRRCKVLLLLEMGIYTSLFSFFTISKYFSFQTFAYDLGIYNQVLHTTLFNGKFLYSPIELLANPSGSLFGVHFSPIFLAILPIYGLHPDPTTLLVLQTFVVSLGALPLYLLASKKLLSERLGLLFATLYLLNPAVQGINWYDFHPEAFLPVLFLFALYFFDAKKTSAYLIAFFLALTCIEYSSVVFIFMALYFLVKMRLWKKNHSVDKRKLLLLLLTILISFVWLFASLQIIHSFNPLVSPMTGEILWREIGAKSLLDVPFQAVSHPERIIQAITFDGGSKIAYISVLLGSVGFLALLEPLIAICVFPWIATALLSNFAPFYQFGDQYPAFLISFLFYGAVLGIQKIKPSFNKKVSRKKFKMIVGIIFCISIIFSYFSSPLNSKPFNSFFSFSFGIPEISQHDRNVLKLIELLPPNASVLTQNNIFPLLSNRIDAFLFPSSVHYPAGKSFENALDDLLCKVDFIIIDFKSDAFVSSMILAHVSNYVNFGLYASIDGSIMLKRDYSGSPVSFLPIEDTFDFKSFKLINGSVVKDPDSKNGYALMHEKLSSPSEFWYGPGIFLPPGRYQATFSLKINNPSEEEIIILYVSRFVYSETIEYHGTNATGYNLVFISTTNDENNTFLTFRPLYSSDFSFVNRYTNFTIDFSVNDLGTYEFRGTTPSSASDIFFEGVKLIQIEPSSNLTLQVNEKFISK